ncbi:hypothetical protein OS493_018347 [Desmophyllum pertusum]|uniref:Uncharacterized protein n=1 Tax=Desmophyllum pertusum TaxID=174260 RepID=A0A9W9YF98_9CNID|nr:hypothetical protein OS493_018347 [Desmophyllum pertusum]
MERIMVARKKVKEVLNLLFRFLREPGLSDASSDSPDSRSSTLFASAANDAQFVHDNQIHDFGIVDFLKAQPYMSKGYEDYSQYTACATVSPLTLSPNPPSFHWSDDSDDDFLAQICSQGTLDDLENISRRGLTARP